MIKLSANIKNFAPLREDMDIDAGLIMWRDRIVEALGKEIQHMALAVAQGTLTN